MCDAPFQYADRCGPRVIQNDVYVEGGRFVLKFEEAVERTVHPFSVTPTFTREMAIFEEK